VSAAVMSAVSLVVAVCLAPAAAAAMADRVSGLMRSALQAPPHDYSAVLLVREVAIAAGPLLAVAALAGAAAGLAQTGGAITLRPLSPNLARLSPAAGLRRLWSARQSFIALQAGLAMAVVLWLTLRVLTRNAGRLSAVVGDLGASGALTCKLGAELGWLVALVGLAIAGVDLALVWHWWRQRLRMTKAEVQEERRTTEGDPHLRAARRREHQRLVRGGGLRGVETAALVVTDGVTIAVALSYQEKRDEAPCVVASASGELALRLLSAARAARVPLVHNPELARSLLMLDAGESVPVRTYDAVAQALRDARRAAPSPQKRSAGSE